MNDKEKKKNLAKLITLKEIYPFEKAIADYIELSLKENLINQAISYKKRSHKK